MNRLEAIDIVARGILRHLAYEAAWEDYPDIGEHDWTAVADRVIELAPGSDTDFVSAYNLLSGAAG